MSPQLMESVASKGSLNAPSLGPANWNPVCHMTYKRDEWVKLLEMPSESSFDEALLLCQESPETWVAWIPDHGEIVLHRSHFYC